MTLTSKIAIAALFTLVAAPAFAGDQDVAALAVSSGRVLPDAQAWPTSGFNGAYASAVNPGKFRNATRSNVTSGEDFQLDGR